MHKFRLTIVLFILSLSANCAAQNTAQETPIKLVLNVNVTAYSDEEKQIIKLWETVLNTHFTEKSAANLQYWLLSEHFNAPNKFMLFLNKIKLPETAYQTTVIALFPIDNETFMLKTMFSSNYGTDKKTQLEYIYSVHVVRTKQGFKFKSLPQYYYQNLEKKRVGSITYCYDKSRNFNEELATKLDSFNLEMAELFKTNVQLPVYFITKNIFSAQQIMGYDFSPEQATFYQRGALTETENDVIFAGNDTEFYPHEIVHLYTHELWGKDGYSFHQWIDEGLAAYFGGYLGRTLEYHLEKMKNYLDKHPNEPLNDISTFYFNIDGEFHTNFMYEIGGLICKKVYEDEGIEGVFDLLKSGSTDADFYDAVDRHFDVKKENFGAFIRKELKNF
jgi:hypothetical protein